MGVTPSYIRRVLERLLERPHLSRYDEERLSWGTDLVRTKLLPEVARKMGHERRLRLALAVQIVCGVSAGGVRKARWRDVDLDNETWTVPISHCEPGRKSRRGRMQKRVVPLSPQALDLFQEARDLRDGILLVRDCLSPDMHGGLSMTDYRRQHSLPRLPPPPPKGALVFPGRSPSEPLPQHAFRYLLRKNGIAERPTDFSSAYLEAKDHDDGKHKARLFRRLTGLNRSRGTLLLDALRKAAASRDAVVGTEDRYGRRYTIDFEFAGPGGTATIRSAWIVRADEDVPRLVTCYIP